MAAPCHPANPCLHTSSLAKTALESREPELVQGRSAEDPIKRFALDDLTKAPDYTLKYSEKSKKRYYPLISASAKE